ncbi:EcsC family protein [Frigidibacter sp. ROC022]|uniref:EcsC family protein n=1 Tax=Frigidibacter sp. ROC022 TaxID=2971796 RepID=UPI00215B4C4C|nr:EcsC family protein [Frigidibacter sp. ROC022]MCR8726629.1 EcsC family protein [Frigidibacter sp. ROC022]
MPVSEPTILDLPDEAAAEVAALARAMQRANGPFMRFLNSLGGKVEDRLDLLPVQVRDGLTTMTAGILEQVYRAAAVVAGHRAVPKADARLHRMAAMVSGAAGGAAGLGSALVELPATVALIFGAMQKAAGEEGFDPASEEVRVICLDILGSGGPGAADDGVNTGFLGARLGLSGSAIHAVIARVAPRFATMLGQKLASQTVPILGAAAGAGVNFMFMDYFQAMARVRFGLRRLALEHGEEPVREAFSAEIARSVTAPDPAG